LDDAARGDFVWRGIRHVASVEDYGARFCLDESRNGFQQCRLSRAVRAEERDDLSFVDLEVHAEQDLGAGVRDVEVLHQQQLDLTFSAGRQHLGLRDARRPDLSDVVLYELASRHDDRRADQEDGDDRDEHRAADPDVVGETTDDGE
jgi:hypothetical protein